MGALDLTGRWFGHLKVFSLNGSKDARGYNQWRLVCICGQVVVRSVAQLNAPRSSGKQSCGCRRGEMVATARGTHGLSDRPLYALWKTLIRRCTNPKAKDWDRYGGRGIKVCKRWQSYLNFEEDMLASYRPGLTLERQNNDGDYRRGNCIWATRLEQMQNTSRSVFVDTSKGQMSLSAASRAFGISVTTLHQRYHKGWRGEKLLGPAGERTA